MLSGNTSKYHRETTYERIMGVAGTTSFCHEGWTAEASYDSLAAVMIVSQPYARPYMLAKLPCRIKTMEGMECHSSAGKPTITQLMNATHLTYHVYAATKRRSVNSLLLLFQSNPVQGNG